MHVGHLIQGINDEDLIKEFGSKFQSKNSKNTHMRNHPCKVIARVVTPIDCFFEGGEQLTNLMIRFHDTARDTPSKRKYQNLFFEDGLMDICKEALDEFVRRHSPFSGWEIE